MNKVLNIILIIATLGAIGTLFYSVAKPTSERFSEFYLLGIKGQAADYPTNFIIESSSPSVPGSEGQLYDVEYGAGTIPVNEKWGRVTLNIVNYEGQMTSYIVKMVIDGQAAKIPFEGDNVQEIGPLILAPENKWEGEIGIVPKYVGDNQKVELFLYKNGMSEPYLSLHLWINIKQNG